MRRHLSLYLLCIGTTGLLAGCTAPKSNGHGIIFGCDGSGAGPVIKWGPSARRGLVQAGYKGLFGPFRWQTGLGVAADHTSTVAYKQAMAGKLAERIAQHRTEFPDDPVYVAGLSAGCAVVIYALEALPHTVSVDQVFLLSSSVSAEYDLSRALKHVDGRIYATTSPKDAVLRDLVTIVGTADRKAKGGAISGLEGFRPPAGASQELRSAYQAKVVNIPWRPEFASYGNRGGHTDVAAEKFVQHFLAPLVVPASGARTAAD